MQIMVASMSIPAAEANLLLQKTLKEIRERQEHPENKAARVLVWGSIVDDTPLIQLIEECGANVVMDDTCVGSRFYWPDVEITDDPLDGIAQRYLDKILCPRTSRDHPGSYEQDLKSRFGYLGEYARDFGANCAILQVAMYCDTHGWEVPCVKDYLQKTGLRVLYIEHDYTMVALESLRTRIQAFLETIH